MLLRHKKSDSYIVGEVLVAELSVLLTAKIIHIFCKPINYVGTLFFRFLFFLILTLFLASIYSLFHDDFLIHWEKSLMIVGACGIVLMLLFRKVLPIWVSPSEICIGKQFY